MPLQKSVRLYTKWSANSDLRVVICNTSMPQRPTDSPSELAEATNPVEANSQQDRAEKANTLPGGVQIGAAIILAMIWIAIFAGPALGNLP